MVKLYYFVQDFILNASRKSELNAYFYVTLKVYPPDRGYPGILKEIGKASFISWVVDLSAD